MAQQYKAWLSAVATIAIVLGVFLFASAFKTDNSETKVVEQIWFSANADNLPNPADLSNYDTSNGIKSENPSVDCNGFTYACAIGFSESDCTETSPGVYQLNANPSSTPDVRAQP